MLDQRLPPTLWVEAYTVKLYSGETSIAKCSFLCCKEKPTKSTHLIQQRSSSIELNGNIPSVITKSLFSLAGEFKLLNKNMPYTRDSYVVAEGYFNNKHIEEFFLLFYH